MAKRFNSENILSLEGYTYVIEIHDSSYSGSSHEFVCTPDGFKLNYDNTSAEIFKAINASRVEFTIIADDAQIEGLQDDIIQADENRFTVKITRNGSLFWYGKIVPDIGSYEDISRNSRPLYKVVALDGLGLLDTIDYNNAGTSYTGKERLLEHVYNCLGKIGTLTTFTGASDVAVVTVVNWHENSMATGAADDPLYLTRVGHASFWQVDNKGVVTYKSCGDVLRNILEIFGARIYQANGAFRIEQITERATSSIKEIRYNNAGTYLSHATINYDVTVDQATVSKITGADYTYFPPVREVKAVYESENYRNYIGAQWSSTISNAITSSYELNPSAVSTLLITFNLQRTFTFNSIYTAVFGVFWMQIKVGNYYLKREIDNIFGTAINYGPTTWTSDISRYYFAFPYQTTGSGTQINDAGVIFNTPILLAGGVVTMQVQFEGFRSMGNGNPVVGPTMSFVANTSYVRHLYAGNFAEEYVGVKYRAESDNGLNNSTVVNYTFNIGDGFSVADINALEVYDGTDWVLSSEWRNGITGGYVALITLLCEEVLSVSRLPVEKWQGVIKGPFDARNKLAWGSEKYLLLGGELNARTDEWSGTYVHINRDKTDISADTPVPIGLGVNDGKAPFNPTGTPSSFGNPSNNTAEFNTGGVVGQIMSAVTTSNSIVKGSVTTIPLNAPVNAGVFQDGQQVTIVNPYNGASHNLYITSTNEQGATSISVSGYLPSDMPDNSYVMLSPQNYTIAGTGVTNPPADESTWWEVYGQHWSIDQTNDTSFPIEGIDIVVETDKDAGDGSTAGIRFDGAGLAAYNNSATYPRFAVSTDGKVRIWQNDHLSAQSGLVYVKDGRIHHSGREAAGMVPQFGHVIRQTVVGYDTSWTAGNQSSFISFTADYEDYEIYAIYWRLTSAGSNNNICYIQRESGVGAVNTMGTLTHNGVDIYGTIYPTTNNTLSNYDIIRFNINAITGTAPKGLYIELYLKVT